MAKDKEETKETPKKQTLAELEAEQREAFVREYQALVQKYGFMIQPVMQLDVRKTN